MENSNALKFVENDSSAGYDDFFCKFNLYLKLHCINFKIKYMFKFTKFVMILNNVIKLYITINNLSGLILTSFL